MTPTVGRVVHYKLTAEQAEHINQRRATSAAHGNPESEGDVAPMIVCRVFKTEDGHLINGQALLDGNDSLWVTSAKEGAEPGTWAWPPKV